MAAKAAEMPNNGPSEQEIMRVSEEAKFVLSVATAVIAQPFIVGRTLTQVGYEPVAPVPGLSFLRRKPGFYLPNTFSYLQHLRRMEGYTALFTGVTPKIINSLLGRVAEQGIDKTIRQVVPYTGADAEQPMHKKGLIATIYELSVEGCAKTAVVVLTQPLHVVMVRMICSLISKDEAYSGVLSSIKHIYKTEGLSGFFSGLVPRWISEVVTIFATGSIMYGLYRLLEGAIEDESMRTSPNYQALVQFYVHGLVYKYQLISTIVAASCPGLNIGLPSHPDWQSCYNHLQLTNSLARGQSMFYREARV